MQVANDIEKLFWRGLKVRFKMDRMGTKKAVALTSSERMTVVWTCPVQTFTDLLL